EKRARTRQKTKRSGTMPPFSIPLVPAQPMGLARWLGDLVFWTAAKRERHGFVQRDAVADADVHWLDVGARAQRHADHFAFMHQIGAAAFCLAQRPKPACQAAFRHAERRP